MIRAHLNKQESGRRGGNILIVTLLLLALFATVGLTIVYYTKDLAEQSRISAEAQSNGILAFDDDGSMAFNTFLANLIYGSPNTALTNGTTNTIVGHDLMRTMYGGQAGSTTAWNGPGTLHETGTGLGPFDRALYVNLSALKGNVLPEVVFGGPGKGTYFPKNAPYTYPDLKDFYLASFVPATGEVLVPSFYRPISFRSSTQVAGTTGLEPPGSPNQNPNWINTNPFYKALTSRPRPADNIPFNAKTSSFPYPPPNADGTYTGDVQNLAGSYHFVAPTATTPGQYVAYNDSIWIDIGLPPMTLLNGKTVKPLVAPLIIDLDSFLNYSVHGNVYSYNGGSGTGIGPWEVNLARALPSDGLSLINARGSAQTASGIKTRSYNTHISDYLPAYAAVSWNTGAGAYPGSPPGSPPIPGNLNLPGYGGNPSLSSSPLYLQTATSPLYVGYDSTNTPITNPAVLYNPAEWSSAINATTLQAFALSDLQPLLSSYCNTPSNYQSTTANPPGPLNLNGTTPLTTIRGYLGNSPYLYPALPAPQQNTQSNYRFDPANMNRGILTPYSWSLDRPGLSPNFINLTAANSLTLNTGNSLTGSTLGSTTAAFPNPGTATGTISDFGSVWNATSGQLTANQNQWNNGRTSLGPIDLNRALADYRSTPSGSLSVTPQAAANIPFPAPNTNTTIAGGGTKAQQAVIDRQQFAMSIFIRLVVAAGADANYQVIPGVGESIANIPAAGNNLNALRALAQLAVNIVDYIDADDISTAFVWNPQNVNDPLNPANFSSLAAINNSVVFGVEKPRVVLNEAFCEMTNDPTDPALNNATPPANGSPKASKPPYIRYWLEFMNPTSAPYSGTGTGPLGNGSVALNNGSYNAYQVQIVRSIQGGGVNVSEVLRDPTFNPTANASNVTGAIVGANPDLTFNFPQAVSLNPGSMLIYAPSPTILLNPNLPGTGAPDWNPPKGQTWNNVFQAATTATGATVLTAAPAGSQGTLTINSFALGTAIGNNGKVHNGLDHNVILLRRLANPYLQPNDPTIAFNPTLPPNPYITVDYMDFVPATDQVLMLNTSDRKRTPGNENRLQYPSQPQSLGKVQPYAGWTAIPTPGATSPSSGTYPFSFPTSLVLPQTANTTSGSTPAVLNTFGYPNTANAAQYPAFQAQSMTYSSFTSGSAMLKNPMSPTTPETLMAPYNWLTHLDRQLLNQTELLQVSMGKPHELTLRFIVPNANNSVTPYGYMATNTINSTTSPTTLYRALDVLRIAPYGQMTALGGRVPGRINLNTIQDKRVWDSLFDSQTWNGIPQQSWNGFTQNDVNTMWTNLIGSRTTTGRTKFNTSGTPLLDASTPMSTPTGAPYLTPIPGATVYDSPAGTDRPFLPFGAPAFSGGSYAYTQGSGLLTDTIARGTAAQGSYISQLPNAGPHPYQQVEALRKIMNNTTTVSHTFAVWVTVGYFDYNMNNPTAAPVLGAEYYNVVPGDLRRKYFGVVDRSMVGIEPATLATNVTPLPTPAPSQNLPFFTTVDGSGAVAGSTTIPVTTSITGTGQVNSSQGNQNTNSSGPYTTFIHQQVPTGTNWIAIGTGPTQEIVRASLGQQTTTVQGVTTISVTPALKFQHWPGESVSNVIPGNPGPPPWTMPLNSPQLYFNYSQAPFSYVVPFTTRLQ